MTAPRRNLLARLPLLLAAVCVIGLASGLLPAGAQSEGSDDIDVLTASRDEIRAELADLPALQTQAFIIQAEVRVGCRQTRPENEKYHPHHQPFSFGGLQVICYALRFGV